MLLLSNIKRSHRPFHHGILAVLLLLVLWTTSVSSAFTTRTSRHARGSLRLSSANNADFDARFATFRNAKPRAEPASAGHQAMDGRRRRRTPTTNSRPQAGINGGLIDPSPMHLPNGSSGHYYIDNQKMPLRPEAPQGSRRASSFNPIRPALDTASVAAEMPIELDNRPRRMIPDAPRAPSAGTGSAAGNFRVLSPRRPPPKQQPKQQPPPPQQPFIIMDGMGSPLYGTRDAPQHQKQFEISDGGRRPTTRQQPPPPPQEHIGGLDSTNPSNNTSPFAQRHASFDNGGAVKDIRRIDEVVPPPVIPPPPPVVPAPPIVAPPPVVQAPPAQPPVVPPPVVAAPVPSPVVVSPPSPPVASAMPASPMLAGASVSSKSQSFAPKASWKNAAPKTNSTYLGGMVGSQPETVVPVTPPTASVASTSSSISKPASFAPKASWKNAPPKANNTYLGGLVGEQQTDATYAPPMVETVVTPPSSAPPAVVVHSGGSSSSSAKPASFAPKASWKSTPPKANNTYLGNLVGEQMPEATYAPPPVETAVTPPGSSAPAVVVHTGSRSSAKPASFAPKASWKNTPPKANNTYLGRLVGEQMPEATYAPPPVETAVTPPGSSAPAVVVHSGGSSSAKPASFAPKASWKSTPPKANNTYLGGLVGEQMPEATYAPPPVETAVTPPGSSAPAVVVHSGGSSSAKPASFAPKASWKSTPPKANNTYLGGLVGEQMPEATYAPPPLETAVTPPGSSAPVVVVHSGGSSSSSAKPASFAPKASWKSTPPKANNTYLGGLVGEQMPEATYAPPPVETAVTPPGSSAPAVVVHSGGSSSAKPASFAPKASWKSTPPKANNTYLGGLVGEQMPEATYAPPPLETAVTPPGSSAPVVVVHSGGSSSSSAKPASFAPKASWKSTPPKANNTYLGNLVGEQMPEAAYAPPPVETAVTPPGSSAPAVVVHSGGSSSAKPASFAPKASWKNTPPKTNSTYLGSMMGGSTTDASYLEETANAEVVSPAPVSPVPSPPKKASFAPKATWKTAPLKAIDSFLGGLIGGNKASNSAEPKEPTKVETPPSPAVSSSPKPASFAPKASWKNSSPKANSTYLGGLVGGVPAEIGFSSEPVQVEAIASSSPSTATTAAAPPKVAAFSPKASWKNSLPKANNTYLGSLVGGTKAEPSYGSSEPALLDASEPLPPPMVTSTASPKAATFAPRASWKNGPPKANNTYLGGLVGGNSEKDFSASESSTVPSPVASFSHDTSATNTSPSAPPASSFTPKATWKTESPKGNSTYLGSLVAGAEPSSDDYQPSSSLTVTPTEPSEQPVSLRLANSPPASFAPKATWKSQPPKANNTYLGSLFGR